MRTVICLGNELRGDDAAGLVAGRRLRERGLPALFETPDALLAGWGDADDVIVIDAVRSGAAAGTIHRVDARRDPLPVGFESGSTHLLGLAEAVELARRTGRLPGAIEIIGIEGRTFDLGAGLSPEVERAVERVVGELASA
jgi:hydrogenase maturation protease